MLFGLKLEKEFMVETEEGRFTIFAELEPGAKLDVTDRMAKELEGKLVKIKEIKTFTSRIEPWSSKIYVKLVPIRDRKRSTKEVLGAKDAPKEGVGSLSVAKVLSEIWTENEQKETVKSLISRNVKIAHVGKVQEKIEAQKRIVEFMTALRDPVKRMIARAQCFKMNEQMAKEVFVAYLGERLGLEVYAKATEPLDSAWGCYNAMTSYATHQTSKQREISKLENASADYLVMLNAPEREEAD